jgi:hypothetical protein
MSPSETHAVTKSVSRVLIGILLLALCLAVGVYVGLQSSWGTKNAQSMQGQAMRANSENDLVLFDADDGTQLDFHANSIWWESDSAGGDGDPPCLREPGKTTEVEVGSMQVANPDGGSHRQAVWVRCL